MKRWLGLLAGLAVFGLVESGQAALIGVEFGTASPGRAVFEIDSSNANVTNLGLQPGTHNSVGVAFNPNTNSYFINAQTSLRSLSLGPVSSAPIGNFGIGVPALTGLTFDGSFSTLYAVSEIGGGGPTSLFSIDPTTGAATAVGLTGLVASDIFDLTTDSSGTIYGMGLNSDLYTFNLVTGAASLVAQFDSLDPLVGVTAIAFDQNDNLFGITTLQDQLVSLDFSGTPSATAVGSPVGEDIRGLVSNMASTTSPAIPEPATLALFGVGLAALGLVRRRRSRV